MDEWLPRLEGRAGPRYRAIADALQQDIGDGNLAAGTRLPTHRELAWRLGVTVGTVTRAYVEAERRGLISGEVGRGTYVRPVTPDYPERPLDRRSEAPVNGHNAKPFVDLAGNEPPPTPLWREIGETLAEVATDPLIEEHLRYRPSQGLARHRAAGAAWIRRFGLEVAPDQVLPTHGAQHAMLLACAALLKPGDVLLTESLTFFGIKSAARMLGVRLGGVEMDEEGLLPAALEAAARSTGAKALYTIPTLQNPTNAVASPERRAAIAEVCRRHGIVVIEDDIYNFLLDEPVLPLSALLPEQSFYLTNLSKSVAPALRVGYLAASRPLIERALTGMRATSVMASPLLQETALRLIESGIAERNAGLVRAEVARRQRIATRHLGAYDIRRKEASFHVWLTLPEPWRREAFAAELQRRGVAVAAADVFATGRQSMPHAIRLSVSSARDDEDLDGALGVLGDLLASEARQDLPLI